jgi:hypothetical protein
VQVDELVEVVELLVVVVVVVVLVEVEVEVVVVEVVKGHFFGL